MADRSLGSQLLESAGRVVALAFVLLVPNLPAQAAPVAVKAIAPAGQVLIVVGLPGDSEHETLFRETVKTWREWLTGPLKFPPDSVHILCTGGGDAELGARRRLASRSDAR